MSGKPESSGFAESLLGDAGCFHHTGSSNSSNSQKADAANPTV